MHSKACIIIRTRIILHTKPYFVSIRCCTIVVYMFQTAVSLSVVAEKKNDFITSLVVSDPSLNRIYVVQFPRLFPPNSK